MTTLRLLLACLLTALLTVASAQEFVAVPPLQTRVTDQIGMLDASQRERLESVLKEYEDRIGSQIAVLLVGTTAPEAIEQYSIRVFDAWKLGRKGTDDGVLLLIAKNNPPALRRMRIEAGRGVQGSLTDAQSKRILQDVMAPHFRQNDLYGGLIAGVSAISALLDQEKLPSPKKQQAIQENGPDGFSVLLFFIFMVIFIAFARARTARYGHGSGWGRSAGIILGSGLGRTGRGGFGDPGGFSSGGFGGSGGFSGGGGSADGGGASGNW